MNRFTTRATVLALVLLLAGGAVFADGHITTAIVLGYGASYATADLSLTHDPNFVLKFDGDVGDYNGFSIEIEATDGRTDAATNVFLDKAQWTTDLLGSLGVMGMPASVTLKAGYFEAASPGYGLVTAKEEEGAFSTGFTDYNLEFEVMIQDQIGVELAMDVAFGQGFIGLTADIAPVQAELFYSAVGGESLAGGTTAATSPDFGGGLEASLDLGGVTVGLGAELNLDLTPNSTTALDFGVGLKADLGIAALGASIHSTGGTLDVAAVDAKATLMDGVAVEAYLGLAIAGAPAVAVGNELDLLEFTVVLGDGAPVKWWLGYVVANKGVVGDKNAPGTAPDGGFYVKAELKI